MERQVFYVQKKFIARLKEDGETLVVYCKERDTWMAANPQTFFITGHYLNYNTVPVNLALVQPEALKQLLTEAWLARAPKTMLKQYQSGFNK